MVSFQSSESVPDNPVGKKSLGIDAGIESFVATSTGKLFKSPKFLLLSTTVGANGYSPLQLLQRILKHKTKGSSNWLKLQKNARVRLHDRIANTRRDWHLKLAHQLCNARR